MRVSCSSSSAAEMIPARANETTSSPESGQCRCGGGEPTVLVLVELIEERPHAAVEREAVAHRAQRDHERLVEDALRGQASSW